MQQVDPPVQIDPSVWATYEAAHVQAEAAIRAAEIGAKATWDAAMLQVSIGVPIAILAAVAALLAGRWTYHAAIRAAQNQTKLENDKHNARVIAYNARQKALINRIKRHTEIQISTVDLAISNAKEVYGDELIKGMTHLIYIEKEPEDWNEENWENHALLGEDFIVILMECREKLHVLNSYKEHMISLSTKHPHIECAYEFDDLLFHDASIYENSGQKAVDVIFEFRGFKNYLIEFKESLEDLLTAMPDNERIS